MSSLLSAATACADVATMHVASAAPTHRAVMLTRFKACLLAVAFRYLGSAA